MPEKIQMPMTSPGSGTRCAMRLGTTKMPEPMTEPTSKRGAVKKGQTAA